MEDTIIKRAAQLVRDLRTLSILKNNDDVKCSFLRDMDEAICIIITFYEFIDEEDGRYKLVRCAFKKEFEKDYILTYPSVRSIRFEIMPKTIYDKALYQAK